MHLCTMIIHNIIIHMILMSKHFSRHRNQAHKALSGSNQYLKLRGNVLRRIVRKLHSCIFKLIGLLSRGNWVRCPALPAGHFARRALHRTVPCTATGLCAVATLFLWR